MHTWWEPGQVIARREVLGLRPAGVPDPEPTPPWYGKCWLGWAVHVVEDTEEHLVLYSAPGAALQSVPGPWPIPGGRHPWHQRSTWAGHGALMVHTPGTDHAIWHFWEGPDRRFDCWYVNLQTAFVRTDTGIDTQDLELDLVVRPDGQHEVKDLELMDVRVAQGRFSPELSAHVIEAGETMVAELEAGRWWWDTGWADWEPDPSWRDARLPDGWLETPTGVSRSV